jgi:hypothetical protein
MRLSAVAFTLLLSGVTLADAQTPPAQPPPGQPAPGQPTSGQRTPPRAGPARPGETPVTGTAVLRGQVFSVDGTPLRRAQVRATGQDGRGGGVSTTDPQGKFEIKELPAGRYSISASKAGYVNMQYGQRRADQTGGGTILDVLDGQAVEKINFALPRGGVITGRILDEFGEPIAGAQVSALRSRFFSGSRRMMPSGSDNTDDTGAYRIFGLAPGEYLVSGTVRSPMFMMPGMTSQNEPDGYAPSYYPGTASVAEAQRITIKGGQELTGVNFALAATKLARIRGRVVNSGGEPAGGLMIMVSSIDPNSMFSMSMMSRAQTRADGSFEVTGVSQGTYSVTARSMMNPMASEVGQARVTVGGEDVDGVMLVMSRGAVARGVVTTDEGTALPVRGDQVRIFPQQTDPNPDFSMGGMPPTVNDDHSFEMTGLFGPRLIRASLNEPGTWFLKSVTWRDQDVTDTPIDFVPGQVVDGLQIVFTRKASEITGSVKDDRGQPALGTEVVIFPADPSRWTFGSRYLRMTSVDQQGRFSVKNMPPYDDYRVVAVQDLEPGRNTDPEFLESVRDLASRVSLIEGGTAAQDLKIVKPQ